MSFNFTVKEFVLGNGTGTPTFQFYRKGFVLGGSGETPSYQDIVLSGVGALTLSNALANGLNYVKLFGACEQRNLPSGYTQVQYIQSSGTQYFDLDYTWKSNSIVDVDFKSNKESGEAFTCLLGAQDGTTASSYGRNYILFGQTLITQFNIPRENGRTLYLYDDGTVAISAPSSAAESYFTNDRVHYILDIASKTIQIGNRTWNASSVASEALSLPTSTLYLLTRNTNGTPDNECSKGLLYGGVIKEGNTIVHNYIPARNSSNILGLYDTVTDTFLTNAGTGSFIAGADVVPSPDTPMDIVCNNGVLGIDSQGNITVTGTTETVEIDTTGDTATAENLFKVGTYQDVQSVLDGSVTRNIGIKVLDGTENWNYDAGYSRFFTSIADMYTDSTARTLVMLSTHYLCISDGRPITQVPDNSFYSAADKNAYFKTANYTSASAWKQFLTTQYNAGTPVIVVYPLETPTTETVTAQPMNIQAGTNIVQITQGSMDGLELEVKYKAPI